MFHGFGYEALFIYHTASNKRPETHLLCHGIDECLAAKFAKSEEAENYKKVFGGFIKFGNFTFSKKMRYIYIYVYLK